MNSIVHKMNWTRVDREASLKKIKEAIDQGNPEKGRTEGEIVKDEGVRSGEKRTLPTLIVGDGADVSAVGDVASTIGWTIKSSGSRSMSFRQNVLFFSTVKDEKRRQGVEHEPEGSYFGETEPAKHIPR